MSASFSDASDKDCSLAVVSVASDKISVASSAYE